MNITFITDPLLTTFGATRPPALLSTELQKRGHDITLISESISKEVRRAAEENSIKVKSADSNFYITSSFPILESWAKSLLKSPRPFFSGALDDDAIVINTSSCIRVKSHIYYAQGPITRALDDMLTERNNGYMYPYRLIAPFLRCLEKKNVRDLSHLSRTVVANSKFCASMYEGFGVKVDQVIPPPLDCDLFKPTTSKPSHDYVLTYFGVYNKETKFSVINQVADAGIRIKAFGYKASRIPPYISRHPNIRFLGGVSNQTLLDLYSNALYVLFTFAHEPFGYIPIESMACGTPVLTYEAQGPSESVVNGSTGWLAKNDKELVHLASKIWNNGYPPEMRRECMKRVSFFDIKKICEKWTTLIRKLQRQDLTSIPA